MSPTQLQRAEGIQNQSGSGSVFRHPASGDTNMYRRHVDSKPCNLSYVQDGWLCVAMALRAQCALGESTIGFSLSLPANFAQVTTLSWQIDEMKNIGMVSNFARILRCRCTGTHEFEGAHGIHKLSAVRSAGCTCRKADKFSVPSRSVGGCAEFRSCPFIHDIYSLFQAVLTQFPFSRSHVPW